MHAETAQTNTADAVMQYTVFDAIREIETATGWSFPIDAMEPLRRLQEAAWLAGESAYKTNHEAARTAFREIVNDAVKGTTIQRAYCDVFRSKTKNAERQMSQNVKDVQVEYLSDILYRHGVPQRKVFIDRFKAAIGGRKR